MPTFFLLFFFGGGVLASSPPRFCFFFLEPAGCTTRTMQQACSQLSSVRGAGVRRLKFFLNKNLNWREKAPYAGLGTRFAGCRDSPARHTRLGKLGGQFQGAGFLKNLATRAPPASNAPVHHV